MFDIKQETDGDVLTVTLAGRLDTTTAPELEEAISQPTDSANSLVFDIADLVYVSSAGLRVFLTTQKKMMKKGGMKLVHTNDDVREIFDVTGFSDFLTIE